jgi:hypothetical protein
MSSASQYHRYQDVNVNVKISLPKHCIVNACIGNGGKAPGLSVQTLSDTTSRHNFVTFAYQMLPKGTILTLHCLFGMVLLKTLDTGKHCGEHC